MPSQSSWQICLPGEWPQIQMGWVIRALWFYSHVCMRQGDVAASSIHKAKAHPAFPLLPFTCASEHTPTWVLICLLFMMFWSFQKEVYFFVSCSKLLFSSWKLKRKFLEVSIVLHLIFFKDIKIGCSMKIILHASGISASLFLYLVHPKKSFGFNSKNTITFFI